MNFKATEEQVKQIAVNAVEASIPMGRGYMQFNPAQEFKPEMFEINHLGIHLDYFQGRMVKLNIWKSKDGTWRTGDEVRIDYQSWGTKYPTYKELVESVSGTEVF